MVTSKYSATPSRDSPVVAEKNSVPARATASAASTPELQMVVYVSDDSPDAFAPSASIQLATRRLGADNTRRTRDGRGVVSLAGGSCSSPGVGGSPWLFTNPFLHHRRMGMHVHMHRNRQISKSGSTKRWCPRPRAATSTPALAVQAVDANPIQMRPQLASHIENSRIRRVAGHAIQHVLTRSAP